MRECVSTSCSCVRSRKGFRLGGNNRYLTFSPSFLLMKFREIAELCEKLEKTGKRNKMVELCADFLKRLNPSEIGSVVCILLGRPFPRGSWEKLEINWMILRDPILRVIKARPEDMETAIGKTGDLGAATYLLFKSRQKPQRLFIESPLEILEVRDIFLKIARVKGPRARERKERFLEGLFARSGPLEAKYLVKIITGEMRTGFREGLMRLAIAKAFGLPEEAVMRACMFAGDISRVAEIAAKRGEAGIRSLKPFPFRPIQPMLAKVAESVEEAINLHEGTTALEYKLDGARVQVHKSGGKVRIFSRNLTDVTGSMPEISNQISRELAGRRAIAEGEVIAVGRDGFPLPFQYLLQRFRRERKIREMMREIPLELQLFDLLYLNGRSLVDLPYTQRRGLLEEIAGGVKLTEQLIVHDPQGGERFLNQAIRGGHEGVIAKKPDSPYIPGARENAWLKIKPTLEPLDLVIVGAEFGYGRRHKWLSDYYLAARDEKTGKYEIVGKTFKGLTDAELQEMTDKLKELGVRREGRRVWVQPSIVVEVAYNEIQRSSKYPCGMALRFARITRIRNDKSPQDADTVERVGEIYAKQAKRRVRNR